MLTAFGLMIRHAIREALTTARTLTSRPSAFLILAAFAISWVVFEPKTFDWHGAATLVTWAMTLFIQRAKHRDTPTGKA